MRTSHRNASILQPFGFVLVVLIASFLILAGRTGAIAAPNLPPDVLRLDLEVSPLADSTIGDAEALESARGAVGSEGPAAAGQATAYLVRATDSHSLSLGADAIENRAIWIVRFSGFALEFPGPIAEDGSPSRAHIAHYAYVLVDAETGEPLDVQYWE